MLVLRLLHVSSRFSGFLVASPCTWGKLQDFSFSKVSRQVVMSFCAAGVALCDIPPCLITCRKSFCSACAMLLRPFQKMSCRFRGRRGSAPWRPPSPFCVAGAALQTSHCALYTPHSTLYTLHSALHTLHATLLTLHYTLHTLHCTLCTLHLRLDTPHSTLHTLHTPLFTLYTPHFTLYTPHSTLYTPHFTPRTPHSTLHSLHTTLPTLHFTLRFAL